MKPYILFAALVMFSFPACRSDKNVPEPTIAIDIQSPLAQSNFNKGDTVNIRATFDSPVELHGYAWEIRRKSDDSLLGSGGEHTHAQKFQVAGFWVNDVREETFAKLNMIAEVDHGGAKAVKSVDINLHP